MSQAARSARTYGRHVPYLFLLPFLLLFIPFGAGAVLLALGISFVDWPIGGAPSFAGTENYAAVLTDGLFRTSLWNTIRMLVVYLALLIPSCLAVAVCFAALRKRARNILQVLFFVPVTMSLIAVALVFDLLYNPNVGFVNGLLDGFGLGPIPFLTDPSVAPWAIVVLRLWRVLGFYSIILFAGLQGIPAELYEAASIDGAGPWARFWYVTLPLLRPVTMFVVVASSIAAWELFAEPQLLTEGGPARSTLTAVMYIYRTTFLEFDLGRGAAAAAVLAVLIIGSTIAAARVLKSRTER